VLEHNLCLMVMENRIVGFVRARCVSDGYGEQDSRLCQSKVYACCLWRLGQQAVVSASCVPDGYGERTAGCESKVCV